MLYYYILSNIIMQADILIDIRKPYFFDQNDIMM